MSHLYFNEESYYSEENATCDNEVFRSNILHHEKRLNIFTLQMPIYYVQYYNRKSLFVQVLREIDYLCCREMHAMFIAAAKTQSAREACHHPAFMDICPAVIRTCYPYLPSI